MNREKEEEDIMSNYNNYLYLMNIEYGFIWIITALGLTFILYTSLSERHLETAGMRARGASKKDVFRLFLGESVSIMFIGVVVGILSGLLTGYTFIKIIDRIVEPEFPREYAISGSAFWFVMLTILMLITVTGIISFIMSRTNLNKALRTRGE